MHYLNEENILLFVIQVAVLLGLARGLGELFRRWGQPTITAEILVGVIMGPTILGRAFPTLQQALFPPDILQHNMLETVAWLGILFFLLNSGIETNFAIAWRQRRHAAALAFSDLTIPMLAAFFPALFLAGRYIEEGQSRIIFAFFIGTIMTISALPVTARVLQDLKVYRTDIGLLIISALTINDVAGWAVFALILGFFTEAVMSVWNIGFILVGTVAFAAICLSLGPRLFDYTLKFLNRYDIPQPAGALTLVCLTGLTCGAITISIGIHALFGFFIAGIVAGESKLLTEHTKHIFSQMVHAILVPLFFASIGLKFDFFRQFEPLLVLFIFVMGVAGRYFGAYVGARFIRQSPVHSKFIGLAHIPGGEMQIVIGILALEYGVISEPVYIAIVIGAIFSSVVAGPAMNKVLRKVQEYDWLAYLPLDHVVAEVESATREGIIKELSCGAAKVDQKFSADDISAAVLSRESEMTTAIDNEVAVPHARLRGLQRSVVIFGRSKTGVDWDARDGKAIRLIFLVLTPEDDPDCQLQILRGIGGVFGDAEIRHAVRACADASEIIALMRKADLARRKFPDRNIRRRRVPK